MGGVAIRDGVLRAKLCCMQHWVDGTSPGVTEAQISSLGGKLEAVQERKLRIGKLRLAELEVARIADNNASERKRKRTALIDSICIVFHCDVSRLKGVLVQQALARGILNCQSRNKPAILELIESMDRCFTLSELREYAEARELVVRPEWSQEGLLAKLQDHDTEHIEIPAVEEGE
eukprot:TRINITY_DN9108_c2_g1_i2.p1 TRINITY_DN9108_c2_g1~~TRINITY_DN9108_c2_g1_i2.p1  ORF type:complete len:176 (-),score=3.25 TRINITY_DN9108_c2_g1_i2:72-599(-)